jgi:hypothetical protein
MSEITLEPKEIIIKEKNEYLGIYQFDRKVAKHYFLKSAVYIRFTKQC